MHGTANGSFSSCNGEGVFRRRTLRREEFCAGLGDVHIVFEPHAKFAADVDAWFVAENHVRCESRLISANQVRPLVAVHSHTVTDAVGEELVVPTAPRPGNHLAPPAV